MHAVGRGVRLNWASGEGEGRMATARGFCRQDLTLPNLTSTPAVWLWGTTHQVPSLCWSSLHKWDTSLPCCTEGPHDPLSPMKGQWKECVPFLEQSLSVSAGV